MWETVRIQPFGSERLGRTRVHGDANQLPVSTTIGASDGKGYIDEERSQFPRINFSIDDFGDSLSSNMPHCGNEKRSRALVAKTHTLH